MTAIATHPKIILQGKNCTIFSRMTSTRTRDYHISSHIKPTRQPNISTTRPDENFEIPARNHPRPSAFIPTPIPKKVILRTKTRGDQQRDNEPNSQIPHPQPNFDPLRPTIPHIHLLKPSQNLRRLPASIRVPKIKLSNFTSIHSTRVLHVKLYL